MLLRNSVKPEFGATCPVGAENYEGKENSYSPGDSVYQQDCLVHLLDIITIFIFDQILT